MYLRHYLKIQNCSRPTIAVYSIWYAKEFIIIHDKLLKPHAWDHVSHAGFFDALSEYFHCFPIVSINTILILSISWDTGSQPRSMCVHVNTDLNSHFFSWASRGRISSSGVFDDPAGIPNRNFGLIASVALRHLQIVYFYLPQAQLLAKPSSHRANYLMLLGNMDGRIHLIFRWKLMN